MATTTETIGVKLVKEVVNSIAERVENGNEEMRAGAKEIISSVRVLTFRSYLGKTWTYAYKLFGKERELKADNVVIRKVSVYGKNFQTVEYADGLIQTLPDRQKFSSWRDFLLKKIDTLAVRHEIIPLGIGARGVVAGKPQLEP